jgi:hypothetical protein
MDWLLAPWFALLAGGWILASVFHAACLLPARAQDDDERPRG